MTTLLRPPSAEAAEPAARRARTGVRAWRWTVGTGVALIVLAALHMVAQHFLVDEVGGLRTYQQVLDYIAHPVIFGLECGLLVKVTIHAMLGLRSVLLDLELSPRTRRLVGPALWTLGTVTIAYGLVIIIIIRLASRA